MMFAKIEQILFFLLVCLFSYNVLSQEDLATPMQIKKIQLDAAIYKIFEEKNCWDLEQIQTRLSQLINEALQEPELLGHRSDGTVCSLTTLLAPTLSVQAGIPSPYFGYVLKTFLDSKRFKNDGIIFQQKTCLELLKFLSKPEYKNQYTFILSILFQQFNDKKYYDKESVEIIGRTIDREKLPLARYILLLTIIDYHSNSLRSLADKCNGFDRKMSAPWLALLVLAKEKDPKYLDKLISITKKADNSPSGIKQATYMFPYLTMVQDPKIIELMKSFLNDEKIIDQGDDIINRYNGLSCLAAQVLYAMIDGYEKISPEKFDQNERIKCIDWFKQNSSYTFRKINYFGKDPVISRMGYMFFESD